MGKDLKGKELGTGLSQRKDGYYVGRYTTKKGVRRQKIFHRLQDCKKWLSDASFEDQHSNIDQPEDISVDAWYQYWIGIKERTVRPNTVRNYRERYEKNIKDVIGNKALRSVNTMHCQTIMNIMADAGYKSTTLYQAKIALYNMLEYAYQNDVIPRNPCNKTVKYNIGKPSEKKEALTIQDQRTFCQVIRGSSYELQFRFVLQTGLRTGELTGLRWSDIDFERKVMTIRRSVEYRHSEKEWRTGPPKSRSGHREIPLTKEALKILELQKRKNASFKRVEIEWADTVFLCKLGRPVKNSTYDTALFKLCDKAGIKRFSMHVLRHTFATRCIEAGMMPKTLQTILGHSNIGITMNLYVHTTSEQKVKEMDMVSDGLMVV